jgi:hypothetical protein
MANILFLQNKLDKPYKWSHGGRCMWKLWSFQIEMKIQFYVVRYYFVLI